ncbi:MAG: hypothetical protein U0T61_02155 [Buchnera aphidicola (Melaphis rhois)]
MIYILGMNEKFVIQKKFNEKFDLIYKNPRICDPYIDNKCKYLFLETLLSAQKILIISYHTISKKNNSNVNASYIVDQLFLYISKNFYIFKKHYNKNKKNDTKMLFSHLYYFHTNEPYNIKNFILGYKYQSFNKTWLNISQIKNTHKNHFFKNLRKIEYNNINISELITFWKNPIKYFFKKRLHITLNTINTINLYQENFGITKLNNYIISSNMIDYLLMRKNINQLFLYYQYKGIIPRGNLGKIYWKNKLSIIKSLYNNIRLVKTKLKKKEFYININKYTLYGSLNNINKTGLLRWKPAIIQNKDMISLWLEHLVYCSIYQNGNSIILGLNNKCLTFEQLNTEQAKYLLNQYIMGYIEGMNVPILLTNSGINWLNSIYDKNNKTISNEKTRIYESNKKMITTWIGNNWQQGEKDDLYLNKIITTLDENKISNMCNTAKKWILPILKHIK